MKKYLLVLLLIISVFLSSYSSPTFEISSIDYIPNQDVVLFELDILMMKHGVQELWLN